MYICVSKNEKELKHYFETGKNIFCREMACINLQNWAFTEIKSAPIPEIEIYKKIGFYLKKKYKKNNVKIILYNSSTQKSVEL